MRRAAGGVQADKSGIGDAFEVIGVAPAEIAVVDADGRDSGLFRFGNRDFGAVIDRDIADIVAAVDEGGNGRFVYDGNGNAGIPGPRLARDGEDARQPGRHDVRRAAGGVKTDKSGIDDTFEVIGVAPAEIAVVDADRRDPGLFRLGNRDFGAAIWRPRTGGPSRRRGCARDRGFADSPLERVGFELSVPHEKGQGFSRLR